MKKYLFRTIFFMSSLCTLTLLTVIFSGVLFAANSNGQNIRDVRVSIEFKQSPITDVFSQIEGITPFEFQFNPEIDKVTDKVSLKAKKQSVALVLEEIARQTGLAFKQLDATTIIVRIPVVVPKPRKEIGDPVPDRIIRGKITDEQGQPLIGSSILIKGTNDGTITDNDGNYSLNIPDGDVILVVTFIGYVTQELSVGVSDVINIRLMSDVKTLGDVVVIGYGEQSKKKMTSSIAKVTAKDIENLPVTSFDQALQGQAAGVHVTSSSGLPGGPVLVRIRGQTSINAGKEPLYVIDGVPVVSGNLAPEQTAVYGGLLNSLSSINPQDIASIEVLKDAAATAIYGSRGANGVILITTKKGTSGKTNITLKAYAGVGEATELLDVLNTEDYIMIKREAHENDNLPIPDWLEDADPSVNTNWQDAIYRTANISQYQLSMDGGNESTTFYLSGSYRNEETILLNSGLERGTFRLNFDHNINDKLTFGARVGLSREKNNAITSGHNTSPVMTSLSARPDIPVKDENGKFTGPVLLFGSIPINPVAELVRPRLESTISKAISNFYLNYSLLPELGLRLDASYDHHDMEQDFFYPSTVWFGIFTQGRGRFATNQTGTFNIEPTVRFEKTYGFDHNISVVMGSTFMERTTTISAVQGLNYINDDLNRIISAGTINPAPLTQNTLVKNSFNSAFARLNYDYNSKYLLSATIRRDGSSRFGKENRYGNFWAVSGGWVFSDESFLESEVLTFGKIRLSYGVTGNEPATNFTNLDLWTVNPGFEGNPGIMQTSIGNPELKWEETSKLDVGLELSFFDNRIGLEADYFINRTKNLLLATPLPNMAGGFGRILSNIGEVENKGFELGINTINIDGEFSWRSRLNITQVKNKIISLVDDEPIFTARGGYIVGEPINILRGLDFLRVDLETGDAMYRDVDEDGDINVANDQVVIGNTLPDFHGGFSNTFSFKGFTLDILMQFVNNVELLDNTLFDLLNGGITRNNQVSRILNRWQKPGDITDVPRVTTVAGLGLNNTISSRYVFDASYLRVKNVTLSYNLPSAITNRLSISRARVYLTGTNLFTITDYPGQDPEATSVVFRDIGADGGGLASGAADANLPQVRMYLAGITLTF